MLKGHSIKKAENHCAMGIIFKGWRNGPVVGRMLALCAASSALDPQIPPMQKNKNALFHNRVPKASDGKD